MKKYAKVVLIGRFQPLHRAHVEIIRRAYELGDRVQIIVGSSYLPRTYKNPFTFDERRDIIYNELLVQGIPERDVTVSAIRDYNDDQVWAAQVQKLVNEDGGDPDEIALIGHDKDESTYYLSMFKQWAMIDIDPIEPLNATDIRELYFKENVNLSFLSTVLPKSVWQYLNDFAITSEHAQIVRERRYIEDYKLQFRHLPYEPVFVTADAVVFQNGHVLLVKRRSEPGKGLWALPGGFLNAGTDKSMLDASVRELKEETGIKVPVPVLKGSVRESRVFDAVNRSARGRTITHAFNMVLPNGDLPKVKGMDDAEKAVWMPLAALRSDNMFEDHYNIIQHFLGN